MVQGARSRHHHSYAEYLAYERDSGLKHEFEDGEIWALWRLTPPQRPGARVGAALDNARKAGCSAFQSDQKVRVLATGKATYPDVTVVSGSIEGDPADPSGPTITNPTLLVEVLSTSTEQDDRGHKWIAGRRPTSAGGWGASPKWQHYQLIPSLQEYVLVSQVEPRVERFRRLPSGAWEYSDVTTGTVTLLSGAVLELDRLYEALPD